jgi:uncharacterized protein (TIGR02284 family)
MNTQEVIGTLNGLLETSVDGAKGFRACARDVKSETLKPVFEQAANRCDVGISELEAQIRKLGGQPQSQGSLVGALHRTWTDAVSTLTNMDEHAVLVECERAEDVAKKSYEEALRKELPPDVKAIVSRQYAGVKENHDRIRSLRDETAH